MSFIGLVRWAVAVIGIGFLAGCAVQGEVPKPAGAEKQVEVRAQARWNALLIRNFDGAFEFLTPTTRQTLPKEVHTSRLAGATWKSAKVVRVACETESCDVGVELEYELLPGLLHKQVFDEKWILADGNWWLVYKG